MAQPQQHQHQQPPRRLDAAKHKGQGQRAGQGQGQGQGVGKRRALASLKYSALDTLRPEVVRQYEYERLPQDTAAEEALIGCVMIEPALMTSMHWMKPEFFWMAQHRTLWNAFQEMQAAGADIDILTVRAWLERTGHLEDAGGEATVYAYGSNVPSTHHYLGYAKIICDCWWRRESINRHSEAANLAYGAQDIGEAFSYESIVHETLRDAVMGLGLMEGQQFGQGSATQIHQIGAMRAMPKPDWIVPGWIGARKLALLYGQSNVGKSFVALDLALSIVSGRGWLGHEIRHRGPVVYVAAEGFDGVLPRVDAWLRYYGKADSDIDQFGVVGDVPDLLDATAVGALIEEVKATYDTTPPALMVIDTLAASMPGYDENSPEAMGAVTAALRRIQRECGCAVLVVHHSGKDSSKGARGHSSLNAAMDTTFELSEDEANHQMVLRARKQRNSAKEQQALVLKLQSIALDHYGDESSAVAILLRDAEAPAEVVRLSADQKRANSIYLLMQLQPGLRQYAQVKRRYLEMNPGVSGPTFDRAWTALLASGKVRDSHTTTGLELVGDE